MKKIYLLATALAIMTMASCSDNDFVGDQEVQNAKNGAIQFVSNTPSITRARTGSDAASDLGYSFAVYATKTVSSTTSNVFAHNEYSAENNTPYWVWYDANSAGTTTSNTSNWDYVGSVATGETPTPTYGTDGHKVTLTTAQTIKYWDYAASQYEFVAYSATVDGATITKYQKDGFTIQATPAQLAGLYVADKLTINTKNATPSKPATNSSTVNKIGDVVRFTFRNAATQVRLGIYETIPGYEVRNIKFRPNTTGEGKEFTETADKAILTGSFNGTTSSSETFNITYNSTTGIAEFDNTAGTPENHFDFGTFTSTSGIGITSTAPTWAGPTTQPYYQPVFPNTDNVANMILYVDYELYNATSHETIKVKGAKAVIPSIYMKWNPNYAYTYLFKISDNTNGTTGTTEGTDPVGLYPITFDAVTIAAADGQEVGTITTVSSPAITTYQKGSVVDIEETTPAVVSKHGITYANANGDIYITVNTNGTLESLTPTNTKLYTVDAGTTEADLVLNTKTKNAVTSGTDILTVPLGAEVTLQGITFATSTTAKFTPTAGITYAVEYKVSEAVAAVYAAVASGTLTKDKKYYTSNTGEGEFISDGTEVSTGSNYFERTTDPVPATYQYKIIEVAAGGGSARLAK